MTDTHAYRMIAHYMKATPLKAMIETLATTATTMLKCTQTTNIPNLPHIQDFIARIMAVSTCDSAVLVLPLVYMHRLRTTTKISAARGMKCTAHRVVLAAMGIAQKITTDVSYSNACWAAHSDIFTVLEYNLMERQLLELLVPSILPRSTGWLSAPTRCLRCCRVLAGWSMRRCWSIRCTSSRHMEPSHCHTAGNSQPRIATVCIHRQIYMLHHNYIRFQTITVASPSYKQHKLPHLLPRPSIDTKESGDIMHIIEYIFWIDHHPSLVFSVEHLPHQKISYQVQRIPQSPHLAVVRFC